MHTYDNISEQKIQEMVDCNFEFDLYKQYDNSVLTVVSFAHPTKFAYGDFFFKEYEPWYMDKLKKYGKILKDIGFDDITLFFEVFCIESDDRAFPQCNFEILNKEFLKIIGEFDVSIPISIYCVRKEQAMDYLNLNEEELVNEFLCLNITSMK